IQSIKEGGGLILVQDPAEAEFDSMPRSAIATGLADLVAPVAELATQLVSAKRTRAALELPSDPTNLSNAAEQLLVQILTQLRLRTGHDFSGYKRGTILRRIGRRMQLVQAPTLGDYIQRLRQSDEEAELLYRDLLIHVTEFFRDREAWETLGREIIPQLFAGKGRDDHVRVWTVGCATGEEAYGLGMLLLEHAATLNFPPHIQLFASDLGRLALDFAREGAYPEAIAANVSEARLARFFEQDNSHYRVRNELRDLVLFTPHNLLQDPPFSRLDLIICRNLLIYLQPLAQRKALSLFHFGLIARGILVLGPSESVGELKDEFETCNNRWRVFRKRRDVRLPPDLRLPLPSNLDTQAGRPIAAPVRTGVALPSRSLLLAYDRLLEHFVSAAFLIDENRDLVHVFGDATRYIQPRAGRLSMDVLELVNAEFKPVLASVIQRVRSGTKSHVATTVRYRDQDATKIVKLEVVKLSDQASSQTWFLITFDEETRVKRQPDAEDEASAALLKQGHVDDLETELRYTKESLQTTVEELETSNEELQATNEELVASNEELQSTNEELHSVNEELYTVNAEYQNKIAELTELTADMDNLLESTEIVTVFLDEGLAIRKYTGRIEEWFDFVPADLGRRISAFSNNLNYPGLVDDIREVLREGNPREREIQDHAGSWLHLRLHPYRRDAEARGVVMTLIDITNLKQTRAKLQRLSAIVESSDDAIIGKTFGGKIESWNLAAERLFGYRAKEAIGKGISIILPESGVD
ncbi:MAG: PAS domain-containing protein, partial [Caldilineaceae bacterium]|nr:PAS domain-containing protein [Caldilineaceae bacterium]